MAVALALAYLLLSHLPPRMPLRMPGSATASASESASASASATASASASAWPEWNSVPNEALPPASALRPGTLRILVLGDSVSKFLGNSMRFRQANANAFVAQRGVGNCSIHPAADGSSCASDWAKDVAELHPDVTFVFLGGGFLGPKTCEAPWRKAYRERLVGLLEPLAKDAGKIVLALPPYPGTRWRESHTLASARCFDADLAKLATDEGWGAVDVMAHMCPTTDCIEESDGWPVRRDGLHPDGPGSFALADWVLGEIVRVAGASARDR